MAKVFQVSIHSSDKTIYDGQAVSLVVPAQSGYLGILADHAPLVAKLSTGKIILRQAQGQINVIDSSAGGFLEILKNQATILL